jgi:hypothetical protein
MEAVRRKWILLFALLMPLLLTACGETVNPVASDAPVVTHDYFEVHRDGNIYIFDDAPTYIGFLEHGTKPYSIRLGGAGPNGETVVVVLPQKSDNRNGRIDALDLFLGKRNPSKPFYGELYIGKRIYVFNRWSELQRFKLIGEATYRYSGIDVGPNGEDVIYVLDHASDGSVPTAMMNRFHALHG